MIYYILPYFFQARKNPTQEGACRLPQIFAKFDFLRIERNTEKIGNSDKLLVGNSQKFATIYKITNMSLLSTCFAF